MKLIQENVETPMRETPEVTFEEIDGDELVVPDGSKSPARCSRPSARRLCRAVA